METIKHKFKGFANLQHVYDSECLIHIEDRNPDEILICFEDIGKGTDWKPIKPLESADLFWKSQGRIFKG